MSVAAEDSIGPMTARLGEEPRPGGWLTFAGAVLLLIGCTNIMEGVAAVSGSNFFAGRAHYILGDLDNLGWGVWLLGIMQGLTALGVLLRNQVARWLGVAFACLDAIAQLLLVEAEPYWSLALFALDIVAIYALVVHGWRTYRTA